MNYAESIKEQSNEELLETIRNSSRREKIASAVKYGSVALIGVCLYEGFTNIPDDVINFSNTMSGIVTALVLGVAATVANQTQENSKELKEAATQQYSQNLYN
jgi:hypothetical protein